MPRIPRRLQLADVAFHLMDRGHNRQIIFADDQDRRAFLTLLERYRQQFRLQLFHYCLMSNHFHLLTQLGDPRQLSAFMAGLLRAYVHHSHRRHGFVGHLFQGRFKSPAVQREGYLLSCGRYIERNPLEARMVAEPWDYGWSSCRFYACGQPDPLVTVNPCYLELASTAERRQDLWREFLRGEDWREAEIQRGDWAVGDEAFRQRMRQVLGRPQARARGRPPKAAGTGTNLSTTPST